MSYVRMVTFSLTREEATLLNPGSHAYNALVGGRKYIAQAMPGLVQTAVLRSTNVSGRVNFVITSEWGSLEDLQAYSNNPVIKELEEVLGKENDSLTVSVYEFLG